jgi:hypothetical protein
MHGPKRRPRAMMAMMSLHDVMYLKPQLELECITKGLYKPHYI